MLSRLTLLALLTSALAVADDKSDFFERDIRPLLIARCQSCHGSKTSFAGLRLDTPIPQSAKSKIIPAIKGENGLKRMPPTGPLNNEEIAKLEKWIALGAPYPATATPSSNFDLITRRNKHWAWQPIKPAKLPPDKPTEKAALQALLRRITFDLTGLPPTPEELREFTKNKS